MSQALYELAANKRSAVGKGASRRLRRADKVPAVVYGAGADAQSIELEHNLLLKATSHESFFSHILTLMIDGEKQNAVIKAIQRHPYKRKILHMDFQRVNPNEKINVNVPLHFVGDETAPGIKIAGGNFSRQMADVEISCLPKDLPEFIQADVSALNVGESLHLSQLNLPTGVEIPALAHGDDHDQAVAAIIAPRGGSTDDDDSQAAADGEQPST